MDNINKKKKQGIIGRTTNENIEKRRAILKEVLDNREPDLTWRSLKEKLVQKFKGQSSDGGDIALPGNETLRSDCELVGYVYANNRFQLKQYSSLFEQMIRDILATYLEEIHIIYLNRTYVLFPFLTHCQIQDTDQESDNINASRIYADDDYFNYFENIKKEVLKEINTNYDLVQISIILTHHIYEQTIAELIIDCMNGNFSYVAVNSFCVQLFCKKQNLPNIFSFIYNILPTRIIIGTLVTYK